MIQFVIHIKIRDYISQERIVLVLFAQNCFRSRNLPIDAQFFISQLDTGFRLWRIEIVALVLEYRYITQYRKTVGKTSGNEQLPMVVVRQLHCHMLSESRRALSDIHYDIKYLSVGTPHQLALCIRHLLVMQSPHHPIGRHALIVLHETDRHHLLVKFPLRERFEEIPPFILEDTWLENHHPLYFCFDNFHLYSVDS